MKSQAAEIALYEIASVQGGHFTAQQAQNAGYSSKNHHYYVKNGAWIKEWRGIYRLARYPTPDDGQYIQLSLWSCNRQGIAQGIFSHETALMLFDLSDINPDKIHMTVPPGFKRSADKPEVIVLHKRRIKPEDCEHRAGYSVLRPIPNLLTVIEEGTLADDILLQTIRDGIRQGYFIKEYLLKLAAPKAVHDKMSELVKRIK